MDGEIWWRMAILKFFFPFFVAMLIWLVVSQMIAFMISGPDRDEVLDSWMSVYLAPILLAILLVSWLQMVCAMGMYESKRMMTFWMVDFQQPSSEISDYIP